MFPKSICISSVYNFTKKNIEGREKRNKTITSQEQCFHKNNASSLWLLGILESNEREGHFPQWVDSTDLIKQLSQMSLAHVWFPNITALIRIWEHIFHPKDRILMIFLRLFCFGCEQSMLCGIGLYWISTDKLLGIWMKSLLPFISWRIVSNRLQCPSSPKSSQMGC